MPRDERAADASAAAAVDSRGVFRFEPVDLLTLGFAALLALAGLVRWDVLTDRSAVLRMCLVALATVVIARLRGRGPRPGSALELVCDFYVVAAVVTIFDGLGPLIRAVNPVDRDAWLMAADRWLLGVDPTVYLERFAAPLLSDLLTICYALYYFHPIVLGALIYADDRKAGRTGTARLMRSYAFAMVAAFYVSYVGYFAVPAIGPRFTIQHAGPLPRGAVGAAIDHTLDTLEKNKRDCFPSGHTMIVAAVLIEARRRSKRTFLWFLPFAIGLLLATVYCRYHYVVDVIAGLVLAFAVVPLARRVVRPPIERTA